MEKLRIREIIDKLLHEIEEEDISISLFLTFYQNQQELRFFNNDDRERIVHVLRGMAMDSKRHKEMVGKIINHLGRKYEESISQDIVDVAFPKDERERGSGCEELSSHP